MTERIAGPGPFLLLRDGRPVGPLLVADSARTRARGLLGTTGVEGALWLEPCASVHMMGMRYPLDAATLSADGTVLEVRTLRPWLGLTRPLRGARITVEASAGFMAAHGIAPGCRLAVGSAADQQ
ncbi:MAG: DUF192 domain-containing protein [Propionicimonas sp.]|nr:DUF192 domain-containing protein [Propionicimonas sp.]